MSSGVTVIGIDPGLTVGMCSTHWRDGALTGSCTLQRSPEEAPGILRSWLQPFPLAPEHRFVVQIERFVIGRRSSRSGTAAAGEVTRDLIGELTSVANGRSAEVRIRNASQVKGWATDERLKAAQLYIRGLQHGRDAARHALFAAVEVGAGNDPLSTRSKA